MKTNGLSMWNLSTIGLADTVLIPMATAVAAAASVPSSDTSTVALCSTADTDRRSSEMSVRSAVWSKMDLTPICLKKKTEESFNFLDFFKRPKSHFGLLKIFHYRYIWIFITNSPA